MGNRIFWTSLVAVLLLCGCKSRNIEVNRNEFTDRSDHWKVTSELTLLSSEHKQTNEKCVQFNTRVQLLADSLRTALVKQAALDYAERVSSPDSLLVPYELYVTDTLFSLSERLVSLRVAAYVFTGGAHGGTDYYAFNYDLEKGVFLTPEQLMDFTKKSEIDRLLASHFNDEGCFTEVPSLGNGFTAFNIGKEAVCFTYPPYALGSYACGTAEIYIPKSDLTGILLFR